jgi:hypothetical protein
VSTITEALKKRQKEVGPEEVQEIAPVSLDDPSITIPRDRAAGRWISLAGIILVGGCVVIGAAMLYTEFLSGKPEEDAAAQVASLPETEEETILPGEVQQAQLTPPETVTEARPAKTFTGVKPGETTATQPAPMAPLEGPTRAVLPPSGTAGETSPDAVIGSTPAPEPPVAPPPDPFAGITLQGIMWFDPASPEALINGKALKVGDSINGIKVVEIGRESVRLRLRSIERVIACE